nr:hypothetical protein [Mycoplasmopsis bovis]
MLKLIDDIPSITPYALDECGHAVFFQKANKVNEIGNEYSKHNKTPISLWKSSN